MSNQGNMDQRRNSEQRAGASEKVGSSREAAAHAVDSPLDFGIPADRAKGPLDDGGREKGPEQGTGPMRSGATADRTVGVGWKPGPAGSGSGGDFDPDVIAFDGRAVSADPGEHRTEGPDITTKGGSEPFASGPPAKGENSLPRGQIGGAPIIEGDTLDHSGGDATTTGQED